MSDVEDAGGSTGQPTPVRVKEVGTTTIACMHETKTILLLIHLVASLEQVLDLKSVGFEDVVGRLKAYEERICGNDGGDEQQRLMLTRVSGGGGSFNGAGGQRLLFTRSNGGSGSSGGGRNVGGGGVYYSGFSGSLKEVKGKVRKNNNGSDFINKDGLGGGSGSNGGSGSKAQSANKPNSNKPNNQPILIPTQNETIGSNQVQGNAELDWNQRHL